MKITVNGKQVEAYSLVMKKEYADEIIKGTKTLEIRNYTPFYDNMFTDREQVKMNEQLIKEGKEDETVIPLKGIEYIVFSNYDKTWRLIVRIDNIGVSAIDEEDLQFLAEDYNFHDFDADIQKYESLEYEDKPMFYYLHVAEIIERENI